MPHALEIGVPYDLFFRLNPRKLNYFDDAYKNKMRQIDMLVYSWVGNYGLSAVSVAIDHCLNGRKARSKYTDKLITDEVSNKNQEEKQEQSMTEEEKIKQTEQIFMKLKIMGINHKLKKQGQ